MLNKILYPLIIFFVVLLLFFTNLEPNSYLLGWDNLMPEFNLPLNLSRALSSVWQGYRGLGHIDAMSHASTLPHTLYIWALSLTLPQSILRYSFTLLTLFLGSLGAYFLFSRLSKNQLAGLVGALFYMLNLGTIQLFFAPLEVFSFHFVALPWLTLLIIKCLGDFSPKNALILLVSSFLLSTQAFVPTVFLSFSVLVFGLLFFYTVRKRANLADRAKRSFLVLLIILVANLYWLLPYLFSLPQTVSDIKNSRINAMSSSELFSRNRARGDLISVLSLKGFMIDTVEYDSRNSENVDFMAAWKKHSGSPLYIGSYLTIFSVILLGLGLSLKRKSYINRALAFTTLVAFVALANNTPLIKQVNELVRFVSPTIAEAFRIPFTKFIILFVFCLSYFLSLGASQIYLSLSRFRNLIVIGLVSAIFCLGLPAFQGQLFSPLLKVNVPSQYEQFFDYMKSKDPDARVAQLPLHTFWNWQYYGFGARGSGFLWYGLPQPILLRAFDPWSGLNEQAFVELEYAMKAEDSSLTAKVMAKYNLSYLLLDRSIINNLGSKPINYERIERFLATVPDLEKEAEFGHLVLYSSKSKSLFFQSDTIASSNQAFRGYRDRLYLAQGNYADLNSRSTLYPFAGLYSEPKTSESVSISAKADRFSIKSHLLIDAGKLVVPSLYKTDALIPVTVNFDSGKLNVRTIYPSFIIDGQHYDIDGEIYSFPSLQGEVSLNDSVIADSNQIVYVHANFPNIFVVKGKSRLQRITFDTTGLGDSGFELNLPEAAQSLTVEVLKQPLITEHSALTSQQKYPFTQKISTDNQGKYRCHTSSGNLKVENGVISMATSCQSRSISYYLGELPHASGYIIAAQAERNSGLALRLAVDNPAESRGEFEAQFSNAKEQFFIIPPTQEFFEGYGVHLTLDSTGFEPSTTKISNLGIYPFPTGFLEQIVLPGTENAIGNVQALKNQRIHSFLYQTSVSERYLIFNQGFNKHWQAYLTTNDTLLSRYLPFIFGKKLDSHFMVNSWANGWEISRSQSQSAGPVDSVDSENSDFNRLQPNLTVIFWPQYLVYLGLGSLALTAISLGIKIVGSRSDRKT